MESILYSKLHINKVGKFVKKKKKKKKTSDRTILLIVNSAHNFAKSLRQIVFFHNSIINIDKKKH